MTDVFQGVLQTFSIIALIVVTLYAAGGISSIENFYLEEEELDSLNLFSTSMSWYEIIMFIVAFGLFFMMNDQTNWESLCKECHDKKTGSGL